MSMLLAGYVWHAEDRTARLELKERVNLRHTLLREGLADYGSALRGLRLLIENSDSLTLAEFKRAAAETTQNTPGIQAVNWVPIVTSAQVPDFLAAVRREVSADFRLRELSSDGQVVPATVRPEYAVITYTYPPESNLPALGYDILTAPTAATQAKARASDSIHITRRFRLVQGHEGIVLICSIRRDSDATPPPHGGPGFAQIVLRFEPMLSRIWDKAGNHAVDVMLVDVTESDTAPVHLYTQLADNRRLDLPKSDVAAFIASSIQFQDIPIGGRLWRAYYRPRDSWFQSRATYAPFALLLGGLLFSCLSICHLRTLQLQNSRIAREVEERTAELRNSRVTLEAIVDNHPGPVWVKDRSGAYIVVNSAFCALYARPREGVLGGNDEALLPPKAIEALLSKEESIPGRPACRSYEATLHHGPSRLFCLVHQFPLHTPSGDVFATAGVATDITASREAEIAHREVERKLLETQKLESLGVLAGGIAHDFNNLLTGILGHANLVSIKLPRESPLHHDLNCIETASQRAAELCQQMLAYSGQGRVRLDTVELGQLVRETLPLLRLSLSKRVRLDLEFAAGLPPIHGDLTQIRQIVMNLLMNASEAIGDHDGEIKLQTDLLDAPAGFFKLCVNSPDLPAGRYVSLAISDSGVGMTPATIARIFDPFFTTKFVGRGLGLSAVLGIVRGHHGAMQVESKPGLGTTFRLYLPAAPVGPDPDKTPAPRVAAPRPAGHLLLVDDEPNVRAAIEGILLTLHYKVDTGIDGNDGLRVFQRQPSSYQAALLDLTMPGMDGIALLKAMRRLRPDLPVLVMSGYGGEKLRDGLGDTPRVAFIGKPFTLADLRTALDGLLEG
jgi:PAS domain S-box-containing protein